MGDLSKNFSLKEMECRCGCGFDDVDMKLIFVLEDIRHHFGKPVTVNCGCRCVKHNAETPGSAPNSRHVHGDAADITVKGVAPDEVADYCESLVGARGGVGRYKTFTHVDTRGKKARWKG